MNNKLYKALTRSTDDWDIGKYQATHKPTNVNYWIANGIISFHNDSGVRIGLLNWIKLWYWLKKAKKNQLLNKINQS